MLKAFVLFLFLIVAVSGFTIDEIIDGNLDAEIDAILAETKKQTATYPFLVTLFLSNDQSGEITSFAYGTIIGKNEILTSMNFYFQDYVHLYLVYNGSTVYKLDDNVELIFSEKYIKDNGWFDALVIKLPTIEFQPHQMAQLNGNPEIPENLKETITIQLQHGHLFALSFQRYPSETCATLGDTFSNDQQICGKGASPYLDAKDNKKLNIFGAPLFVIENGEAYLLGFNAFYYEIAPSVTIMQKADFLCSQKFVNYEFSCRNFNASIVENVAPFSDENLEEVLNENPAVVAIFKESIGIFNWKREFLGFGVAHSSNAFLLTSSLATTLSMTEENEKVFVSSKNHKNVLLEIAQIEINSMKDVSSWHDIAFITTDSIKFAKDERAILNESPEFHSKDLKIIEQISETEIAWAKYDLYSDKVCARAFSDIHCCEFGPEQQICGPNHPQRFESTPLFDDQGRFVGIHATKNQYDHGQNVDVFTRIDANIEWIKSYF